MKSIGERLNLPLIFLRSLLFKLREEQKVRKQFYGNDRFKRSDRLLKKAYRFQNPYRICKLFRKNSGSEEVHVYGETPLTELHRFLLREPPTEETRFVDLGSGRGRLTLFVSALFSCRAVGVEIVPEFQHKAAAIAGRASLPLTGFPTEEMTLFDLSKADLIYFYALCLEEDRFEKMIKKLSSLKKGVRIVTVSFPLSDYIDRSETLFSEKAVFPWGETEFFFNVLS